MEFLSVTENKREVVIQDWFNPGLLPSKYEDYFTVEWDAPAGSWAIKANSYVGTIPLSPDYAIQIRPKSGLQNLTYMLYKSGLLNRSLETPFDQTVPYKIPEDDLESFIEGLIRSFLHAVDQIKVWGLMRESLLENRDAYAIRGKINYPRWVRSFPLTGGIPIPQSIWVTHLNNVPNLTLRYCLEYLHQYSVQISSEEQLQDEILGRLDYFGRVRAVRPSIDELLLLEHEMEAGRFPASRYYYLPALNLALLILRGAGLALADEQDVLFKPILVNTADMFEKYIRVICQESVKIYDAHAVNGKDQPLQFYQRPSTAISVKPDILIRRGGSTLLVLDAKYKFAPTEQDHYQMWAYTNAHQVKRGGFISIAGTETRERKNPTWFERYDYAVFDYAFDNQQIDESERKLKEFISNQLELVLRKHQPRH